MKRKRMDGVFGRSEVSLSKSRLFKLATFISQSKLSKFARPRRKKLVSGDPIFKNKGRLKLKT